LRIGAFDVRYVSHVCFLFTSPGGNVVLTDPLFAEGFEWKGKVEKYLSPPEIAVGDITRCDAVFVSHIHGDHYDPDTIKTLVNNTAATVWAPPDVTEDLAGRGVTPERLVPLAEGASLSAGDVEATAYAGYDNSFDEEGRANKFSLLLQADGTRIFYSGDCHDPPPAMSGQEVDATFAWPHPDDGKLAGFCRAFKMPQYVLMHGDKFEPGDFFCNFDYAAEKRRVEAVLPNVEVVVPERVRSI